MLYVAKDVEEMTEKVHKDLGHYGKTATMEAMKKHYVVPRGLISRIESTLDACIPCQLHKSAPPTVPTLHRYNYKEPFECWGIDFIGPLVETPSGNQYLITAIDFNTSKALAYPHSPLLLLQTVLLSGALGVQFAVKVVRKRSAASLE